MRKPSKRTWLVLAALVAGVIVTGLTILTVTFPDGNELVTLSNYLKLENQNLQKQMSVEEVEAILGPADKIYAYQAQGGWVQEMRCFAGQRGSRSTRQRVYVSFGHGQMLYARYECEYDPALLRKVTDKLQAWFRRLRR
jgi:hypothetical protein